MTPTLRDRLLLLLAAFAILAVAIGTRPEKRLNDFDQSFYLTIAYDLDRWGTFSNGIFDRADSTQEWPGPGMFFVPVYPALVYAAMQVDPRFHQAVQCHVSANEGHRPLDDCDFYARPVHLIHAGLLALAVLAIGLTGQALFGRRAVFWLSGALAVLGLVAEADLFSFVMTESTGIALFSVAAYAQVTALLRGGWRWTLTAGVALGLLILARPSFQVLAPIWLALFVAWPLLGRRQPVRAIFGPAVAFLIGLAVVIGPWLARNAMVLGKTSLTEEYGAATLIERLAFNTMTMRETALAFPYCVPVIGPTLTTTLAGPTAMDRFQWDKPGSFFATGRAHRETLVAAHGRLDPVIAGLLRDEWSRTWHSHLMSTIPMAWCGLWVSQGWSLALLPLFAVAGFLAWPRAPVFLLYAAPAIVMVGIHAAVGNHYPRYNLMLVGPISVGSAWIMCLVAHRLQHRRGTNARTV